MTSVIRTVMRCHIQLLKPWEGFNAIILKSKHDTLNNYYTLFGNPDDFESKTNEDIDLNECKNHEISDLNDDGVKVIEHKNKKLFPEQYLKPIRNLIKEKKLSDAINVLEQRMLKEDNIKPFRFIYNTLISSCGKVGYHEKAWKLYNDMKERAIVPSNATYTGLFNSFSNTPFKEKGLEMAVKLRSEISKKNVDLNQINYHSMIKAFGCCGDVITAFDLVDEMMHKKITLNVDTFNFLMFAAIQNKQNGFFLALMVWNQLRRFKITPTEYTYNLLLRATRDCGYVDLKTFNTFLTLRFFNVKSIASGDPYLANDEKSDIVCQNSVSLPNWWRKDINTDIKQCNETNLNSNVSLLHLDSNLETIIQINEMKSISDKFALIGGLEGVLLSMERDKTVPNIKTFSLILELIPSNEEFEQKLLDCVIKHNVKPDINFLNLLIRKRSFRNDPKSARNVLCIFPLFNVKPNIMTFGVLALNCKTLNDAKRLLNNMDEIGFRPNAVILGALLKEACYQLNFSYVVAMLNEYKTQNIKPTVHTLLHLEKYLTKMKNIEMKLEKKMVQVNSYQQKAVKSKAYKHFRMYYPVWLKDIQVEIPEHPWQQFKNNTID